MATSIVAPFIKSNTDLTVPNDGYTSTKSTPSLGKEADNFSADSNVESDPQDESPSLKKKISFRLSNGNIKAKSKSITLNSSTSKQVRKDMKRKSIQEKVSDQQSPSNNTSSIATTTITTTTTTATATSSSPTFSKEKLKKSNSVDRIFDTYTSIPTSAAKLVKRNSKKKYSFSSESSDYKAKNLSSVDLKGLSEQSPNSKETVRLVSQSSTSNAKLVNFGDIGTVDDNVNSGRDISPNNKDLSKIRGKLTSSSSLPAPNSTALSQIKEKDTKHYDKSFVAFDLTETTQPLAGTLDEKLQNIKNIHNALNIVASDDDNDNEESSDGNSQKTKIRSRRQTADSSLTCNSRATSLDANDHSRRSSLEPGHLHSTSSTGITKLNRSDSGSKLGTFLKKRKQSMRRPTTLANKNAMERSSQSLNIQSGLTLSQENLQTSSVHSLHGSSSGDNIEVPSDTNLYQHDPNARSRSNGSYSDNGDGISPLVSPGSSPTSSSHHFHFSSKRISTSEKSRGLNRGTSLRRRKTKKTKKDKDGNTILEVNSPRSSFGDLENSWQAYQELTKRRNIYLELRRLTLLKTQ
eukprot:Awhi_evm1s7178